MLYNSAVDAAEVTEHLLRRADLSASRSGGAGGQRRDKVSTKAELTVTAESLEGLDAELSHRLTESLGLDERALRITVQEERLLSQNQEIARERLLALVTDALRPPAPPRRPTRPSRARREARLDEKTRRAGTKRLRQGPTELD